ncbi:MAG: uridine kinase [Firmicutes bacterium]|nr:uridine kinase [Bacillota bacterium]
MNTLIIGIAGGTGSGKTTLTQALLNRFSDDISVIFHDNYYRDQKHLTLEERNLLNYDHPKAFETELLIEHLEKLKKGEEVLCPVYDFSQHTRSDKVVVIKPKPIIVLDGILILEDEDLNELLDIKLFVDTDADVRILRRIERDINQRGRSFTSVRDQYLSTVKPMHERYVEPSKRQADIVIPEGGRNKVAIELLLLRLKAHLDGQYSEVKL